MGRHGTSLGQAPCDTLIHVKPGPAFLPYTGVMTLDWTAFLAACSSLANHGQFGTWIDYGRPAGMFLFGLVGSIGHCAGMCGPFVLSQVGSRLSGLPLERAGRLARLRGAALLPYHAGRLTTYSLLGAAAGGLAGGVEPLLAHGYLPAIVLMLAALGFAVLGIGRLAQLPLLAGWRPQSRGFGGNLSGWWQSRLGGLFRQPTGWRGYLLGLGLGFLPCGLIYGALLLAGASGNWRDGLLMMAAFALGTMPGLLLIGLLGAAAGARWRGLIQHLMPLVLLLNAALLALLALRWLAR